MGDEFETKFDKEIKNHNLLIEFDSVLKREVEIAYEKSLRDKDHYFYFRDIKFLCPIWTEEGLQDCSGQLAWKIAILRWARLWIDCVNLENLNNIKEVLEELKNELKTSK